jgi:excisionase family DNA binding protein
VQINDKTYDLNVFETAELLGYHPQTVRDLARKGELPALKRRHAWYFNKAEIENLISKTSKDYIDRSKLKHDLENEFGGDAEGSTKDA